MAAEDKNCMEKKAVRKEGRLVSASSARLSIPGMKNFSIPVNLPEIALVRTGLLVYNS